MAVPAFLAPLCVVGWLLLSSPTESHGGSPSPLSPQGGATPGGSAGDRGADGAGGGSGRPERGPLAGKVVVVDPGHNPGNRRPTEEIARQVGIGTGRKECDTTGTATDSGYAEADFTLDVSRRVRTLLEEQGAKVVLTHDGDRPYGPCVDERAEIGNRAHADAAVSIHADGSAEGDRGFHVILPEAVRDGAADTSAIVDRSRELGERVAGRFLQATGSSPSNYIGEGTGLDVRSDLGGLNLSRVPKVFIECGNMRDTEDAALLRDAEWRSRAARGIYTGVESYLTSES